MTFKELKIDNFNPSYLSEYNVYLIASPITVFLWQGEEVSQEILHSSLSIIKAFFQEKQPERLENEPSYIQFKKFSQSPKIRLEF